LYNPLKWTRICALVYSPTFLASIRDVFFLPLEWPSQLDIVDRPLFLILLSVEDVGRGEEDLSHVLKRLPRLTLYWWWTHWWKAENIKAHGHFCNIPVLHPKGGPFRMPWKTVSGTFVAERKALFFAEVLFSSQIFVWDFTYRNLEIPYNSLCECKVLFCKPSHKIETETANMRGTTNSKPIRNMEQQSDHIY
jgi:hypothetical protein